MLSSVTSGAGLAMPALVAMSPEGQLTIKPAVAPAGTLCERNTDGPTTPWASDDGAASAAATATNVITHLNKPQYLAADPTTAES